MGIYAKNRPEWMYGLLALISQNITVVPLYDTLGTNQNYFFNDLPVKVQMQPNTLSTMPSFRWLCAHMKMLPRYVLHENFYLKIVAIHQRNSYLKSNYFNGIYAH